VSLAIAALNVLALRWLARRRKDVNAGLLQERAKLMGVSMAGLQAIETLKASGSESDFFSRWAGHLAKVTSASQKMELSTLGLAAVPPLLAALDNVAVLGVGSLLVLQGHLTVGMLVAFQSLMVSFLDPVNQLVGLGSSLQEVEGEMNRLDDVLRHPADPALASDGEPLPPDAPVKLSGRLELRDVKYGYSRLAPPAVEGFSLGVRPGARVALVGPSASGKTTVAKVVSGLYQAWDGEVLLDGRPRSALPRAALAGSVAVVDQDFFLPEGTVREVLTMWDATVPEEDLVRAARDACIHEDIVVRPGGYDSKVDEGGVNFSGGQRQRLEIARALVGNPTLLVLDEATSALDPLTEKRIDDNLRRRGCTCVIVAHRLSTIRDCDEILVLDRGRVVQRGPHEALLREGGLYRRLIQS
jgi:ABC-type bacteriocin/lantibiotic exporter with double-glycine peptidase domain